jgi:hypothetical protein
MNLIEEDTVISIENVDREDADELSYTLCDYICYCIQIFIIGGLIYIIFLFLYLLYRMIEIITRN